MGPKSRRTPSSWACGKGQITNADVKINYSVFWNSFKVLFHQHQYHVTNEIIYPRSKYFATALTTGVGNAKSKSEMEVMDCSHKVLTCIVNFMYGFPIPEDFDDPQGLLHQADFFMMEDLKSAVGLLIAKNLSLETLKELVLLAERYREVKLQEKCG